MEFFDNVRIDSFDTDFQYKCKVCGQWKRKYHMSSFQCPVTEGRVPEYHKAEFICNSCANKDQDEKQVETVQDVIDICIAERSRRLDCAENSIMDAGYASALGNVVKLLEKIKEK